MLQSGDAAALSESRFGRGCGSQSGWWRIDRTRRIFLRVILGRKQRQKNHEIDGRNLSQAGKVHAEESEEEGGERGQLTA